MEEELSAKQRILKYCSPEMEVPFSLAEYEGRLQRIRTVMAREGIDLLYLTAPESMCYVSGYQAEWYQAQSPKMWPPLSGVAVHVDHDRFILFDTEEEVVMTRYATVSTDTRVFDAVDLAGMLDKISGDLAAEGWLGGTAGLEMYSYRPNRAISEKLQTALEGAGCQVVDGTDVLREVRAVKSPQELATIETAARIGEIGLQAAADVLQAGVTELDVYAEMMYAMHRAGGENPGITLPVLSGPKSACPHALASRRRIMPQDIVSIDVCGVYNRYHANMARTFSVGQPHPEVARTIERSAGCTAILRELLRPNLPVAELNERMEAYYREAGIWEDRMWIGGYELGIAFPPDWVGEFVYDPARDSGDERFRPGTVVNYESNFYLPHNAGASLLIHTLMFSEEEAKVVDRVPPDLIVVE